MRSNLPLLRVNLGRDTNVMALIDTGSSFNLISKNTFNELREKKLIKGFDKKTIDCYAANNQRLDIEYRCKIIVKIHNFTWLTECQAEIKLISKSASGLGSKFKRKQIHY